MNPRMAELAQRHEVILVMRTPLCQRQHMVYLFYRTQPPLLLALFTERVLCGVAVTDAFPCPAIPTAYSRVSVVLLVASVLLLFMLLTKTPFCQLLASGEGTRPLWFPWHRLHLPCGRKPPQDSDSPAKALLTFFHAISNHAR